MAGGSATAEAEAGGNYFNTTWLNAMFKKIRGRGQLAPPSNFRICACLVCEWRTKSRGQQEDAIKAFKCVPASEREDIRSMVLGEESPPQYDPNPDGNYLDTTWLNATFKKMPSCGKLAPSFNWCTTAARVREWRKLRKCDQELEIKVFKALPLSKRKEFEESVPGEKKVYPRQSRKSSSGRRQRWQRSLERVTRSSNVITHTSLSDSPSKRKPRADNNGKRLRKKRRKRVQGL